MRLKLEPPENLFEDEKELQSANGTFSSVIDDKKSYSAISKVKEAL